MKFIVFLSKNELSEWNKELKKNKPSLINTYFRVFWFDTLILNIISVIKVNFH
jgi:hypothetical protein